MTPSVLPSKQLHWLIRSLAVCESANGRSSAIFKSVKHLVESIVADRLHEVLNVGAGQTAKSVESECGIFCDARSVQRLGGSCALGCSDVSVVP